MHQHQGSEHVWGNMKGHHSATNSQTSDTRASGANEKCPNPPTTAGKPRSSIDLSQLLIIMNNLMAYNTAILQRSSK